VRFYGNGIVWDAERNTRLCKFKGGELDTCNERVIQLLSRMGYRHDDKADTSSLARGGIIKELVPAHSAEGHEAVVQIEPDELEPTVLLSGAESRMKQDDDPETAELRAKAKELKIRGYGIMNRAKLTEKIQEATK
jgi:hypothetical protein